MWPSLYSEVTQIRRKGPNFASESQFGGESIPARIENLVDEDREKMLDCDVFRNYWIDSLEFLNYPECRKSLNYFPPAENQLNYDWSHFGRYLLMHPMSRPDSDRKLELFYIKRLIKDFSARIHVVIITEEKYLSFYDFCEGWDNVTVISTDLYQSWDLIRKAEAFIGVDSSMAHFAKSSGKPYFVFNNYCHRAFDIPAFQQIRWIQSAHSSLPPNFDAAFVVGHVMNCIQDYARFIYPTYGPDLDQVLVRRKFIS